MAALPLKLSGWAFLTAGACWAAWSIATFHPYVVWIIVGIACTTMSTIVSEGLLRKQLSERCLPDEAGGFVDCAPSWGRRMQVRMPRCKAQVADVVDGLQTDFIAWVFRRNLDLLPTSIQRILQSEKVSAVLIDVPPAADDEVKLTGVLESGNQERRKRCAAALRRVLDVLPREAKFVLAGLALPGYVMRLWEYLAALTLCGWAARLTLRASSYRALPLARLLFPMLGATADVSLDSSSTRTARTLSAMGFIGASVFALHALYLDRHLWRKTAQDEE
mmetsp:Transcript_22258/g.40993  ORF Transcript_22258/g.40993 Transcript_22258/m.40993 type:complete len:277 (-) Transcript_22258:87-917(-)